VQIGANDGIRNDPIRQHVIKYGWQGLLVEPVPHVFRSLKHNYAGQDRLSFANVAVDSHSGRATMLTAKELAAGANNPMSSMSSFHEDVVKKHEWLVESLDGLVEEQQVPTVTLRSLLNDYAINRIDGLFVDTEGHDKVVLDQLNLATHKPQFILYEHVHLSRTDQATLIGRFEENGYSITAMRRDTFAELPLE
jgi:FkbM family methyltransferase